MRLVLVLISCFATCVLGQTVVSSQVQVTETGYAVNRVTQLWSATMTVVNTSQAPISGPIAAALTNLPAGVILENATGIYGGAPYIEISSGTLAAGASAQVTIQFNKSPSFTPVTYSGL